MSKFRLIRLIYNLLFPVVLLFLLPRFLFRMLKRGKYRHKFGQRFGIYSDRVREKLRSRKWIWMHAVSVGEVLIAFKLIAKMKSLNPDLNVVLSSTTSTGFALANEKRSEWLEPIYNPVDFFWSAKRVVEIIRPSQLVLVEAEVWPNIIHAMKKRGVSIALVNARLSPRSESRYRKFRWFTAPLFNELDAICVQEPEDVPRWESLGVSPQKIRQLGSIKFDYSSDTHEAPCDFASILNRCGITPDAPIILGGSTWPGEENALARCFSRLRDFHPELFLILVPRHVERAVKIRAELESQGYRVALRSQITDSPVHKPDILLVDTTGELRDWYRYATVVFVGKSLTVRQGQNPAEAISEGKPVVFGPHMENFELLVRGLLRAKGAIQVADEAALEKTLRDLFQNPGLRESLARQGKTVLSVHDGAAERTAQLLASLREKGS